MKIKQNVTTTNGFSLISVRKSMRTNVFVKCVIDFGMKTDATQQNVNEIE